MKTVHLVFNAHIDPIWLWPWTSGLDAVLNTCETMCNLLDRNPEVTFTRGEAWAYDQIERIDPALFRRIKAHVEAGRWEIVGGWWIQPDCNLPGADGFRKQIELGRDYFRSRFGQFPTIGYNVDSFGHASILPRIMREYGQTHYVMMRPQEHEKKLPARLFRWQGEKGGPVVTTFRIAHGYNNAQREGEPIKKEWIEKSVSELPAGVDDTMFFLGFGDHGGGPSQAIVDWCRSNPEPLPGVQLKFSSPSRFFRAVAKHEQRLPLVEGDLQYHAIGCYSVYRQAKTEVRRAENLLLQAGEALKADRALAKETALQMESAWKRTCFHHFHDTMGGTCVPSAYPFVFDQLGEACSTGAEIVETALRRKLAGLAPHVEQRLVLQNNSGQDWNDYVDHEPWLDVVKAEEEWIVRDERGRIVPHQRVLNEAVVNWGTPRLFFKLAIAPGERRVLRIAKKSDKREIWKAKPRSKIARKLVIGRESWPMPELKLIEDKTDTWSHGIHGFAGPVKAEAKWSKPELIENGPLLEAWWMDGRIGESVLGAEWRVYLNENFFELRLHVNWREQQRVLRLEWKPGRLAAEREDGVPGTGLRRPNDGSEHPVRDRTLLSLQGGGHAGAVFPGVFSLSATREALRLTLLRSPQLAQHDPPVTKRFHRARWSDQGGHDFVVRFYPRGATAAQLDRDALALQRVPTIASITRGMPGIRPSS